MQLVACDWLVRAGHVTGNLHSESSRLGSAGPVPAGGPLALNHQTTFRYGVTQGAYPEQHLGILHPIHLSLGSPLNPIT